MNRIHFETKYFQKFKFTRHQIDQFFNNALRDIKIARQDKFSEVKFTYAYQALVKAGIALIAKVGGVKVRGVPGHHVKILEKMSEALRNPDALTLGNAMRTKRNSDFYGGGESITEKEAEDYLKFVEKTLESIRGLIE